MTSRFPDHRNITEPFLSYHPLRTEDIHRHPLLGLLQHGPFSRSLINCVLDPIRVAILAPFGRSKSALDLICELESKQRPAERFSYLPEFPGMSRVFGVRVVPSNERVIIELSKEVDNEITRSSNPRIYLAEYLTRSIKAIIPYRADFDVLLLLLSPKWQQCFFGLEGDDFDLHDYVKAMCASQGVPLQIMREDSALIYRCRCSVMWRLSLALYTKAGGVPWKMASADPETAFIGLSYAIRKSRASSRFVTCCSQVFDSDGSGLEFLLYETDDVHIERDNPFLSRSEMRRLMERSLALYQRRHPGHRPKNLVIHKSTEFREEEVDGCFDVWQSCEDVELIQIVQDVPWRGIKIDPPQKADVKKGSPAQYPCERGTFLPIDDHEVLLWTQGNAPSAVGGKNFFKEGKGIPSPLLLRRYAGCGTWDSICSDILGLTKMNWNNDSLYDRLPVTIGYSKVLARTIKQMTDISAGPFQLRFFM